MRKVFTMVIGMVVMTGCSVTEVVRGPVFPAESVVRVVVAPTAAALVVGQQLQSGMSSIFSVSRDDAASRSYTALFARKEHTLSEVIQENTTFVTLFKN